MIKQASNVRKHLRRFLTADPGRFAGGSAVSDPLGLLAVERERLAALRSPQHDGSPQAAATANQGTQPGPGLRLAELFGVACAYWAKTVENRSAGGA
jgi:hypothetical protein